MRACVVLMVLLTAACAFRPQGAGGEAIDAAIGDGTTVDATTTDAPPPDARLACPAGYTVTLAGARYAWRTTPSTVTMASIDCDDDLAGRTHLATFENADLDAVMDLSGAAQGDEVYLGGDCNTVGAACDLAASWVWIVNGSAVNANLWAPGEPSLMLTRSYTTRANGTWGMESSGGVIVRPYLCECEP